MKVEGDLRKEISQNISRLKETGTYRECATRRVYRSEVSGRGLMPDQAGPESNYWSFEERDIGRKRSGG